MAQELVSRVRYLVLIALAVALIIAGAYLMVPIPGSPVPVVLQNLFVVVAGMVLGPLKGTAAVAIYLAMGALGLPVLSGGSGGIAHFAGPTGGYLIGFLAATLLSGVIARGRPTMWRDACAAIAGMVVIYILGVPWLKTVLDLSWPGAAAAGLFPFLFGDAVKVFAAVGTARLARRTLGEQEAT